MVPQTRASPQYRVLPRHWNRSHGNRSPALDRRRPTAPVGRARWVRSLAGLVGVLCASVLLACGIETSAPPEPSWRPFAWVEFRSAAREERLYVVFDQSLETLSSPFDVRFAGLSQFAYALEKQGAATSVSHQPLSTFLPGFCGPHRVVVLGIPWQREYSDADLQAVEVCLLAGAGVLALAEHDNIYGHADRQNRLLERFGVRVVGDAALGRASAVEPLAAEWPLADSEMLEQEGVQLYLPAPLEVDPPAVPLLELQTPVETTRKTVAALAKVGEGRFAVVGDLELFWNMTPETGVRRAANLRFCLSLVQLLGGDPALPSGARGATRDALPDAWTEGARTVLFESGSGSMVPDGRPNGLTRLAGELSKLGFRILLGGGPELDYSGFDLVVVAVPKEELAAPERILVAPKLLLIGDGQQNLFAAEPELAGALPLDLEAEPERHPLDALAKPFGFQLLDATLLSSSDRSFVRGREARGGARLWILRGGAFRFLSDSRQAARRLRVHALADPEVQASWLLSPVQRASDTGVLDYEATPDRTRMPRPGYGDLSGWPVIVGNEQVLAFSDFELLSDSGLAGGQGASVRALLARWLSPEGAG